MKIRRASICLQVILFSLTVSSSRAASPDDTFFSITKRTSSDSLTNVDVIGRGITDSFCFTPTEDQTVYNNNQQLLIGDKIYTDKKNSVYIITDGKCVQRDYVGGNPAYELNVYWWRCNIISAKMADAKRVLFSDSEYDNYNTPYFTTVKKYDGKGGTTIKVTGKGVADQYTFGAGENCEVFNKDALVIGVKLYSGGQNSVVVVENGICTERKYTNGRISEASSLSGSKCHEIISSIQNAKKSKKVYINSKDFSFNNNKKLDDENDKANGMEISADKKIFFTNDKVKFNSHYFSTSVVHGATSTAVQVVGKGIKDKIIFQPHEDTTVYKTEDTLVIGDKIFTDKPNSLTMIEDGRCQERMYSRGSQIFTKDVSIQDCQRVIRDMKIAKSYIDSDTDATVESGHEDPFFTVVKEAISKHKVLVEVYGNGVHDTFQIGAQQDTKVFNEEPVLIVGDWLYTDRPNSLKIIEDGQCKENVYKEGKKKEEITMNPTECDNLKLMITMAKSPLQDESNPLTDNGDKTMKSDNDVSENTDYKSTIDNNNMRPTIANNDYSTPYFTVSNLQNDKHHVDIEVVGNGINEQLRFNTRDNPNVYKNGNTLIVGNRYYTDKPNSLTEILNGQCTERSYVAGEKQRREIILSKRQCDEIIKTISKVKGSPEASSDAEVNNNNGSKYKEVNLLARFLKSLPHWLQGAVAYFFGQRKS